MKKSLGLMLVLVLMSVSTARAEMPKAGAIEILLKGAIGEDVAAARALVKIMSEGPMKAREEAQVLAKEAGLVIVATGKDADVVIGAAPYASQAINVGIARVLHGELQGRVEEVIALTSKEAVFDPFNKNHNAAMRYILRFDALDTEKLGDLAQDSIVRFGNKSNVTLGDPSILRIGEGRYVLVQHVRINALAIDADEVQELIDAAKDML